MKTITSNTKRFRNLNDEALVNLISTTNSTLFFEILMTRFESVIYDKISAFIDNQEEAIELTKTFFVILFSEIHLFKGPYDFSVWLYERAYRMCATYLNTTNEGKLESELDDYLRIEVSDAVLYKMKPKKLKQALSLIGPEDKAILMLRYQDEVSIKNLGFLLRLNDDSVKYLLRKAKARIVKAYSKL